MDKKLFELVFHNRIQLANIIRDANLEYDALSWVGNKPSIEKEYFIADKIIEIFNQKGG